MCSWKCCGLRWWKDEDVVVFLLVSKQFKYNFYVLLLVLATTTTTNSILLLILLRIHVLSYLERVLSIGKSRNGDGWIHFSISIKPKTTNSLLLLLLLPVPPYYRSSYVCRVRIRIIKFPCYSIEWTTTTTMAIVRRGGWLAECPGVVFLGRRGKTRRTSRRRSTYWKLSGQKIWILNWIFVLFKVIFVAFGICFWLKIRMTEKLSGELIRPKSKQILVDDKQWLKQWRVGNNTGSYSGGKIIQMALWKISQLSNLFNLRW